MKKRVLIGLDLIGNSFTGLGRTACSFSSELAGTDQYACSFILPKDYVSANLTNYPSIRLNWHSKLFALGLEHYDLCHILHPFPNYKISGAKRIVLTIHDLNFLYIRKAAKQKKYCRRIQRLIDRADAVCFISESTRRDCLKHLSFSSSQLLKVIYNGVDALAPASARPQWCPPGPFLFALGQFTPNKNFKTLIAMMRELPSLHLVIAGINASKIGDEIREEIKKYGLGEQITLPGSISEGEKSFLYEFCEAFVFPSIAEGFGIPVLEAMKCGKPVFCSSIQCMKEIGSDYACYWEHFEPCYMARRVLEWSEEKAGDEEWLTRMKQYADSYSWKRNVQEYLKVYHELLDS